jgi:hypothetical protein
MRDNEEPFKLPRRTSGYMKLAHQLAWLLGTGVCLAARAAAQDRTEKESAARLPPEACNQRERRIAKHTVRRRETTRNGIDYQFVYRSANCPSRADSGRRRFGVRNPRTTILAAEDTSETAGRSCSTRKAGTRIPCSIRWPVNAGSSRTGLLGWMVAFLASWAR